MSDLISRLSEIRSQYNCFSESEEPYYRALSEVIKMLSEQVDGDIISRKMAIDLIEDRFMKLTPSHFGTGTFRDGLADGYARVISDLKMLPSAQPERKDFEKQIHDMFDHIWDCEIDHPVFQDTVGELMNAVIQAHNNSAQPERKTGKWLEKKVIHADEAKEVIEEWQSCKCSACGRYDTRPYMYYFSEPHYCSWCGAFNGRTEGEDHE